MIGRRFALSCRLAVVFSLALGACDATPRAKEPAGVVIGAGTSKPVAEPREDAAIVACQSAACSAPSEVCCSAAVQGTPVTWCASSDAWRGKPDYAGADGAGIAFQAHAACLASQPAGVRDAVEAGSVAAAACDDSSDCAAGEVCCAELLGDTITVTRCVPPGEVGTTCYSPELCRRGTCRTGDTSCRVGPGCEPNDSACHGLCENTSVAVPCGGSSCSGASGLCCMEGDKGSCVASASDCSVDVAKHRAAWPCTTDAHCGSGMTCCVVQAGMRGASCRFVCNGPLDAAACTKDGDCARHPGGAQACNPVAEGPPGAKACLEAP